MLHILIALYSAFSGTSCSCGPPPMGRGSRGPDKMAKFGTAHVRSLSEKDKTVTFGDVAGADEERKNCRDCGIPEKPDKFIALGARIPKGVIGGLRGPATPRKRWQGKRAWRSCPSPVPTLWRCTWASARPASGTHLNRRKSSLPPLSLSMKSTLAASAEPVWAADM